MKIKHLQIISAILLSFGACAFAEKLISDKPLPIFAYCAIPQKFTCVERYKEFKEAGFSLMLSSYTDMDAQQKALDCAQQAGVKEFINYAGFRETPAPGVKRFMSHPALAGYHVKDEPNIKDFDWLRERVEIIRELDPNKHHLCYFNLFPVPSTEKGKGTKSYLEYFGAFTIKVPLDFISFDCYPIIFADKTRSSDKLKLRPHWYANLELFMTASKVLDKPFWGFVLSSPHGSYPYPTIGHLRLQAYSNLAYGAQTIQYYTYWEPNNKYGDHKGRAPITIAGKRTPLYDMVKSLNAELQQLAGVFVGAKVKSLGHTGETIPIGTKRYVPSAPVKNLKTSGSDGAVVSLLENKGKRFLVIVNRSVKEEMDIEIVFDKTDGLAVVEKGAEVKPLKEKTVIRKVLPGDIAIFKFE